MSRIGNSIINIPEGVALEVKENIITVKGKLGELSQSFDGVSFDISDNTINVIKDYDYKAVSNKQITMPT